jgi:hypothetical protein
MSSTASRRLEESADIADNLVRMAQSLATSFGEDVSDIYRAVIVLIVAFFEEYIHELERELVLSIYHGNRSPTHWYTQTFSKFITKGRPVTFANDDEWIDNELKRRFGQLTYQKPHMIEVAISRVSNVTLWPTLAMKLNLSEQNLLRRLNLLMQRRHLVVHTGDQHPVFPGRRLEAIERDAVYSISFIRELVSAIDSCV